MHKWRKFQPLVIGKAAKPRAFNNKMLNDIIWRSNTKAWMTANTFKEYIQIWNKEMIRQNIKVLLLLDNASYHPEVELANVKMIHLQYRPKVSGHHVK